MRTHLFSLLIIGIMATLSTAQDKVETKLDSVLTNQHKMLENQQKLIADVHYVDPLAGKRFGIELNPGLLLTGLGNDNLMISTGFSLFNLAPRAEIAFPIYFRKTTSGDVSQLLTFDLHYRLFFSEKRKGFYASTGARYAYLESTVTDWHYDIFSNEDWEESKIATANKFGLFFGIGYRYFSKIGIYWGASIITGTYFSDDSGKFDGFEFMDAGKFLFDIEFMKIGYAF